MSRLPKLLLAAALLASTAACGGGAPPQEAERAPAPGTKGSKEAVDPKTINTPYAAISAGKVDVEGGLVDIAARSQGTVRQVMVEEGDKVKMNEILAKQEDDDSRLSRNRVAAQLAQAEAQIPTLQVDLVAAKREQNRLETLIKEKAIAQQAYDQATDRVKSLEAQLDAQQAAVKLVRAQLAEADYQVELHIIRAPADGVIVRRYANPGMGASTLNVTPMFQLQPDSQRIVRAEVEERSLGQVKLGQSVEIVPESDQEKSYAGKVLRIAGVMGARKLRSDDPSERADERVVEVVVDAEQAPVLIGQRVLVKFLKDDAKRSAQEMPKTAER